MFVTLGIEEHDTAIVEVEGGAGARVVLYSVPSLPVAPDTFYNDDRLLIAMGIELLQLCILFYLNTSQLYWER